MQEKCLVTLATPVGRSAIATIMLSGAGATGRAESLFQSASGVPLKRMPINRVAFGKWKSGDGPGEELVVCRRSENAIEIQSHGGAAAPEAIISSLVALGCRQVAWQEWLHGTKEDLVAVEARIACSAAQTIKSARILLDQLNGALSNAVRRIIGLIREKNGEEAGKVCNRLLQLSPIGRHLVQPWKVVLVGAPNVGKSSLINAILGYDRAIVFDQPGTTRDVIVGSTAIDGWLFEFADTAGMRTPDGAVERQGIDLAQDWADRADIRLLIFDVSTPWGEEDAELLRRFPDALVICNKQDLPGRHAHHPPGICTSAVSGQGIKELLNAVVARAVPLALEVGEAVPFTERQVLLLEDSVRVLEVDDSRSAIKLLEQI